jgi:hypothetical protein
MLLQIGLGGNASEAKFEKTICLHAFQRRRLKDSAKDPPERRFGASKA